MKLSASLALWNEVLASDRFLRDESQSSHGVWVTWTSFFTSSYTVVVWAVGKGWDRYRLGHLAVAPLNVQSGHSKVLNQGSSCAAMGRHP